MAITGAGFNPRHRYVELGRSSNRVVISRSDRADWRIAMLSAKLVKNAELKVYKGAPHGMCTTLQDRVDEDLLDFVKA
jgi:hypothetical protein